MPTEGLCRTSHPGFELVRLSRAVKTQRNRTVLPWGTGSHANPPIAQLFLMCVDKGNHCIEKFKRLLNRRRMPAFRNDNKFGGGNAPQRKSVPAPAARFRRFRPTPPVSALKPKSRESWHFVTVPAFVSQVTTAKGVRPSPTFDPCPW